MAWSVSKGLALGGQFCLYSCQRGTYLGHGSWWLSSQATGPPRQQSGKLYICQLILRAGSPSCRCVTLLGPAGTFKQWKEINHSVWETFLMSQPKHWLFLLQTFCCHKLIQRHHVYQKYSFSHFSGVCQGKSLPRLIQLQDHWVSVSLAEPGQTGPLWNLVWPLLLWNGEQWFLLNHKPKSELGQDAVRPEMGRCHPPAQEDQEAWLAFPLSSRILDPQLYF